MPEYSGQNIIAWGCGKYGHKAKLLLGDKIQYFVDSNPELHGTEFEGRTVLSPEEIAKRKEDIVLLIAVSGDSVSGILQKMKRLGIERFLTMPVVQVSYVHCTDKDNL